MYLLIGESDPEQITTEIVLNGQVCFVAFSGQNMLGYSRLDCNYNDLNDWMQIDWHLVDTGISSQLFSYQIFSISGCEPGQFRKNNECLAQDVTASSINLNDLNTSNMQEVGFISENAISEGLDSMTTESRYSTRSLKAIFLHDLTTYPIMSSRDNSGALSVDYRNDLSGFFLAGRTCMLTFPAHDYSGETTRQGRPTVRTFSG